MRISAKADYAVRAMVELAAAAPDTPVKAEALAAAQSIPVKFLENILAALRRAGLVTTRRGMAGGYLLSRDAADIALAEVLRAVDGPLAAVQGVRPNELSYAGSAARLPEVWVAVRASLRDVLEHVSLADVADGTLPAVVSEWARHPDSWRAH